MKQQSFGIRPPAYRLPDATRLGAVRLQVSDLARSVAYYEQVLGLRARDRGDATATLAAADGRPLVVLETRPGVTPAPPRATLGLYHFAILLPDRPSLGRFLRHLAALGARAGMADHLVSEAIYLTDPDGLGIEVYADRPRDSWRVRGEELAMTTDPLDAEAVAAAGGSEPWTGMPAGTVLGHVHLHVGNLDEGAAFYHAALGFDKIVWSYPGALFLSAGGYHHHLGTNTWSRGPVPAADQARLLSWDIVVPTRADAAAAAASVAAAGYGIQEDDGAFRAADPWGTTLRLAPETV
ncbi:MAG TPA: VOC family protein [Vicinamibacterales bacterium]